MQFRICLKPFQRICARSRLFTAAALPQPEYVGVFNTRCNQYLNQLRDHETMYQVKQTPEPFLDVETTFSNDLNTNSFRMRNIEHILNHNEEIENAIVIGLTHKEIFGEHYCGDIHHPFAFVTLNDEQSEIEEEMLVNEVNAALNERMCEELDIKVLIMDEIPTGNQELVNYAKEHFKEDCNHFM